MEYLINLNAKENKTDLNVSIVDIQAYLTFRIHTTHNKLDWIHV